MGDEQGVFFVMSATNNTIHTKKRRTFKWRYDAIKYFEDCVKENHENILVPKLYNRDFYGVGDQKYQNISALINKKELIIIYPIDRTEDNGIRSFSNRYGLIYDTIIDGGDFAIINKATIYEEELFSIVNKKISNKDTRWIMKNIIENDLSEDNEKKIYVLNTTLIIENGNNTYDIIKTYKQKSDILRLYFKLEELYKDNKFIMFMGDAVDDRACYLHRKMRHSLL